MDRVMKGTKTTIYTSPGCRTCNSAPHAPLVLSSTVRILIACEETSAWRLTPMGAWWSLGADDPLRRSPLAVLREHVIPMLHSRVAREPARGVVPLRGVVRHGAGPERLGRGVIREHGPAPS